MDELVLDDFLDVRTGRAEVFTRVEGRRMRRHVFANSCGQAEAQVGIDVDLADRRFCRAAELIFRDTDGVVQCAAVLVDDLDKFRHDRGSAVQHNREVRQAFLDFRENIETKFGRNEYTFCVACALGGFELECAVAGADGNGERVDAGFFDEFLDFLGARIRGILSLDVDVILNARKLAELAYNSIMGERTVTAILVDPKVEIRQSTNG